MPCTAALAKTRDRGRGAAIFLGATFALSIYLAHRKITAKTLITVIHPARPSSIPQRTPFKNRTDEAPSPSARLWPGQYWRAIRLVAPQAERRSGGATTYHWQILLHCRRNARLEERTCGDGQRGHCGEMERPARDVLARMRTTWRSRGDFWRTGRYHQNSGGGHPTDCCDFELRCQVSDQLF
jgi:hypothetical protein